MLSRCAVEIHTLPVSQPGVFPKTRCQSTQVAQGSEILEWLQEFRKNSVDDEIPERGDSHASSSHEVSLESTFKRREDFISPKD